MAKQKDKPETSQDDPGEATGTGGTATMKAPPKPEAGAEQKALKEALEAAESAVEEALSDLGVARSEVDGLTASNKTLEDDLANLRDTEKLHSECERMVVEVRNANLRCESQVHQATTAQKNAEHDAKNANLKRFAAEELLALRTRQLTDLGATPAEVEPEDDD